MHSDERKHAGIALAFSHVMDLLMNNISAADTGYQPNPSAESQLHNKPYSGETQFASIIKDEYTKAAGNDFNKTDSASESSMKKSDEFKSDQPECNKCSEDFDEASETIRTDKEDEDSETSENKTESAKDQEVMAQLLELINNYTNEIENSSAFGISGESISTESAEAGIELNPEAALTIEESPDTPFNGSALPEIDSEQAGESVIDEEGLSARFLELNAESDDSEADKLLFEKELPVEAEVSNEGIRHIKKAPSEEVVELELVKNHEMTEGVHNKLMSEYSNQFNQGHKQGDDSSNFGKSPQHSVTDSGTDNVGLVNSTSTLREDARSIGNLNTVHSGKATDFQALVDKIVYVAKGNNKLGISVEHESLGKLNMSLTLEKGMVNVHINTSDRDVRELIESNMQQILDSLNKDGVSVGEFSVGLRNSNKENMSTASAGPAEEIISEEKIASHSKGLVNIFA